jgi:hypothetical protein
LSPQLSKISKITSQSASSVFDFLPLAQSWLRSLAASGNSTPIAISAEFVIFSPEAGSKNSTPIAIGVLYSKLQSLSSLTKLPNVVCDRLWKWYATALGNPVKLPKTICNRFVQPLMETVCNPQHDQ